MAIGNKLEWYVAWGVKLLLVPRSLHGCILSYSTTVDSPSSTTACELIHLMIDNRIKAQLQNIVDYLYQ